jgi:hypothetical protein
MNLKLTSIVTQKPAYLKCTCEKCQERRVVLARFTETGNNPNPGTLEWCPTYAEIKTLTQMLRDTQDYNMQRDCANKAVLL